MDKNLLGRLCVVCGSECIANPAENLVLTAGKYTKESRLLGA